MSFFVNDPVVIQNPSDVVPSSSSTRDDNTYVLTQNALPALETRIGRYALKVDRTATAKERAQFPIARFSVDELIGFMEDAAVYIAARVSSRYLGSLKTTRNPSSGEWDFSNDLRILGGTAKIDGSVRAQRISEDVKSDMADKGGVPTDARPYYTLEGSQLKIYGTSTVNPNAATVDVIALPNHTILQCTGTYDTATNVFQRSAGDLISADYHTLVNASLVDSVSDVVRGVLTDINEGTQSVRMEIDDSGFTNSGTITMTWKTPSYSSLYEFLEEAVVELAAADAFAAMGEIELMNGALTNFEFMMETYGLRFFKL